MKSYTDKEIASISKYMTNKLESIAEGELDLEEVLAYRPGFFNKKGRLPESKDPRYICG